MQKYILSSFLMINSAILMSQNIAQTNILIIQNNTSNVFRGNWLTNESRSNINKLNNTRNITIQQQSNVSRTGLNNLNNVAPYRVHANENPVQNQSVVRRQNPVQTQQPYRNNQRSNIEETQMQNPLENANESIPNENNDPIFTNGNLEINTEMVQNKQIHFLANNNNQNIQTLIPQINFEFNIEQQAQTKTTKVKTASISQPKEVKVKTFIPLELKPANTRIRNSSSESTISETTIVKIKTEKIEKHNGGSSYSQKNKSYLGKKIKIWYQKNFKFAKKIRMSVSCPKF